MKWLLEKGLPLLIGYQELHVWDKTVKAASQKLQLGHTQHKQMPSSDDIYSGTSVISIDSTGMSEIALLIHGDVSSSKVK